MAAARRKLQVRGAGRPFLGGRSRPTAAFFGGNVGAVRCTRGQLPDHRSRVFDWHPDRYAKSCPIAPDIDQFVLSSLQNRTLMVDQGRETDWCIIERQD